MTARAPPGGGGESGREAPVAVPLAGGEFSGEAARGDDCDGGADQLKLKSSNSPRTFVSRSTQPELVGMVAVAAVMRHQHGGEDTNAATAEEAARGHGNHVDAHLVNDCKSFRFHCHSFKTKHPGNDVLFAASPSGCVMDEVKLGGESSLPSWMVELEEN